MTKLNKENLIGVAALLIHAAKIDDNFTDNEKKLISDFISSFIDNESEKLEIYKKAEDLEQNSNQLISFTNIIKKNTEETKYVIIEQLWKIIISDNSVDQYESNLIRRICGLIYFSDKLSGEIKLKIIKNK